MKLSMWWSPLDAACEKLYAQSVEKIYSNAFRRAVAAVRGPHVSWGRGSELRQPKHGSRGAYNFAGHAGVIGLTSDA